MIILDKEKFDRVRDRIISQRVTDESLARTTLEPLLDHMFMVLKHELLETESVVIQKSQMDYIVNKPKQFDNHGIEVETFMSEVTVRFKVNYLAVCFLDAPQKVFRVPVFQSSIKRTRAMMPFPFADEYTDKPAPNLPSPIVMAPWGYDIDRNVMVYKSIQDF